MTGALVLLSQQAPEPVSHLQFLGVVLGIAVAAVTLFATAAGVVVKFVQQGGRLDLHEQRLTSLGKDHEDVKAEVKGLAELRAELKALQVTVERLGDKFDRMIELMQARPPAQ